MTTPPTTKETASSSNSNQDEAIRLGHDGVESPVATATAASTVPPMTTFHGLVVDSPYLQQQQLDGVTSWSRSSPPTEPTENSVFFNQGAWFLGVVIGVGGSPYTCSFVHTELSCFGFFVKIPKSSSTAHTCCCWMIPSFFMHSLHFYWMQNNMMLK